MTENSTIWKFIYFIILEISIGIFLKSYGYLSFYSFTLFTIFSLYLWRPGKERAIETRSRADEQSDTRSAKQALFSIPFLMHAYIEGPSEPKWTEKGPRAMRFMFSIRLLFVCLFFIFGKWLAKRNGKIKNKQPNTKRQENRIISWFLMVSQWLCRYSFGQKTKRA